MRNLLIAISGVRNLIVGRADMTRTLVTNVAALFITLSIIDIVGIDRSGAGAGVGSTTNDQTRRENRP